MLSSSRSSGVRAAISLLAAVALVGLVAPTSQARPTWDTTPVDVTHDVRPQPKVVDLRVGEHQSFDRVVIDLDGKVPGYDVQYVRQLAYDGSGRDVPLKGRKFIAVALTPAKAHGRHGHSVYSGPKLQQYDFPALRGVALTGDFEGYVSFGLALRRRAEFRVLVLHAPNRIAIDLRH
jgi:hypothetical protein